MFRVGDKVEILGVEKSGCIGWYSTGGISVPSRETLIPDGCNTLLDMDYYKKYNAIITWSNKEYSTIKYKCSTGQMVTIGVLNESLKLARPRNIKDINKYYQELYGKKVKK